MANTIKIKRGTGTSALADGELGFNTLTNTLYIGNSGNKILGGRISGRNLLACLPLSSLPFGQGDASGSSKKGTISYDSESESLHFINQNSNIRIWLKSDMPVQQGETYVVSCWVVSAEEDPTHGEEYQFQISYKNSVTDSNAFGNTDKTSGNFYSFLHKDTLNTGWTWRVFYQVFTAPENANFANIAFRTGFDFQNYTNNFFVKNFKIEQGSVYSEWSPAPEELLTYSGGTTIPISKGGTGATSASGACTNLGAVKKTGDTISGSLKTSKTSLGYYLTDGAGNQYPAAYDNGSNLWIGAVATSSTHHKGETYISSGHNGTSGNSTIKICVPNSANNGGTSYSVLHSGNYSNYASFTTPLTVKNGSYAGKVELSTNSEGGNIVLGSKNGTYLYQWDAYQDSYMRFFVQNTAGTVLNGEWYYNADTGSFTTKILNIGNTTEITGIVYSSSQPSGTTGKIWLKPI